MSAPKPARVGIIGGGLMGREVAAAISRWPAIEDHPVRPRLVGVCDRDERALAWFDRIDSVRLRTTDYRRLLAEDEIDALYIAVPHHLHERIYIDAIAAGKDFLGEKPFGIDEAAAHHIVETLEANQAVFARCSSEMPFFPGAQRAFAAICSEGLGKLIEAHAAFLHSSDLDLQKKINWKRQQSYCGRVGVLGDLGMHALHVPLRLGWMPQSVFGVLQDVVPERPGPDGEPVPCDTIDNATLVCELGDDTHRFPMFVETKRIAPGESNTWSLRVVGLLGGVAFSTRNPAVLWRFKVSGREQVWEQIGVGSQSSWPTITGPIFEFGFSDAVLQMLAAFFAEREGMLGDRFGCATPQEAHQTHLIFEAALRSSESCRAVALSNRPSGNDPD